MVNDWIIREKNKCISKHNLVLLILHQANSDYSSELQIKRHSWCFVLNMMDFTIRVITNSILKKKLHNFLCSTVCILLICYICTYSFGYLHEYHII